MKLSLIAAIVLSLLMAFFATQNSQPTKVTFLGWFFDGPLVVVLLLTFAVGVLAALLATLPGAVSKKLEVSRLKARLAEGDRKIGLLEKQVGSSAQVIEQKPAGESVPRM
jgi:uncharacterized integral membrane protein